MPVNSDTDLCSISPLKGLDIPIVISMDSLGDLLRASQVVCDCSGGVSLKSLVESIPSDAPFLRPLDTVFVQLGTELVAFNTDVPSVVPDICDVLDPIFMASEEGFLVAALGPCDTSDVAFVQSANELLSSSKDWLSVEVLENCEFLAEGGVPSF